MPTVQADCTGTYKWEGDCKLCEKFTCKANATKTFNHQDCFPTEAALTSQVQKSTEAYKTGTPAYPNVKCEEDHSGHDPSHSGAPSLARTLSSRILSMPSIIVGTVVFVLVFVVS